MMDDSMGGGMGLGGQVDGDDNPEGKLCRDFMRNVCNRGKNCRFIHPPDVKIKTDPIFCHDYQQSKCFRATCKFIHCTREEEEHYKATGELPEEFSGDYYTGKPMASARGGKSVRGGRGEGGGGRVAWIDSEDPSIPLCKDYLKGVCDRPPGGCKFRHVEGGRGYRGGSVTSTPAVGVRRRAGETAYYGQGPEAKRPYEGYATDGRLSDYDDFYNPEYSNPPPPPPTQSYGAVVRNTLDYGRNGYGAATSMSADTSQLLNSYTSATAMKAMEDENFMLKRRIEELKKQVSDLVATNEYLLSQNATLRLTNMNTINMQKDAPNAGQVGIELTPSMTVAASQISTLPTVSMVLTPSMAASAPQITLPVSMTAAVSQMTTLPTMSLAP